ncbi:MAG: hypothetical protein ACRYGL_17200 [Janthinobacterium lividum]
MKKFLLLATAGALAASVGNAACAHVSIGIGIGAPYYAPPPVMYAPPVVYAPPPVVYAPPRVAYVPAPFYGPPPVMYGPPVYRYRHGPRHWHPHPGYYAHGGYYGPRW